MRLKLRLLSLLLFLFIINTYGFSQISGLVLSPNDEPIPGVNIYSEKYKIGTTTNDEGIFKIKVRSDAVLEISCIGYLSQTLDVSQLDEKANSSVIIRLFPMAKDLSSVAVFATEYKRLNANKHLFISDFEFSNGMLYVFSNKFNRNQVSILSPTPPFDTIANSFFNKNILNLYKDCFDNIHLINKDSAFQTYIDKGNLNISHKSTFNSLFSIFGNIVLLNKKNLYTLNYKDYNQTLEYYQQNIKTKEISKLCSVTSENDLKALKAHLRDIEREQKFGSVLTEKEQERNINYDESEINNRSTYEMLNYEHEQTINEIKNRNKELAKGLANLPLIKAVSIKLNPLFNYKDTLYFISTNLNQIQVFDNEGSRLKVLDVDFKFSNNKIFTIQMDSQTGKCFAIYLDKTGVVEVYEISLKNGELTLKKRINHIIYPDKVKVYNDYLFILHNEIIEAGVVGKQLTFSAIK